jgi:hypothetical protein
MQSQDWLDIATDAEKLEQAARALALRARALSGQSNPPTTDHASTRGTSTAPVRAASPGMPARPAPRGEVPTIKVGRNAGLPIAEADDASLRWYADLLLRSINDESKQKWRQSNEADLAAVRAEQQRRAGR